MGPAQPNASSVRLLRPLGWALLLACLGAVPLPARADPLEELQRALVIRPNDSINPTDEFYSYRQQTLSKQIANLKTLPELRRALALKDWKDEFSVDDKRLQKIDAEARKKVAEGFAKKVRGVLRSPDPNARLAVANLLAEMGPNVRSLDGDRFGFLRSLTPEVLALATDKNLAVRQEGLRALGNINAAPEQASKLFAETIKNDAPGPRLIAARGLAQLVRVSSHLSRPGKESTGVEATQKDVVDAAAEAIRVAPFALQDPEPPVRLAGADALLEAARAMSDAVPKPFQRDLFPPAGRKPSENEKAEILASQGMVRKEIADVERMLTAFKGHAGLFKQVLADPEFDVRLTALQALDHVGYARAKLRERALSVPVLADQAKNPALEALHASDPVDAFKKADLTVIIRLLKDQDVRIRRGAIDFIEMLEEDGLPALPDVIAALGDPDRFVRWAAARTLGQMPAEKAAVAAPALGKLLFDSDNNIRKAAAEALEQLGPLAREAVPALAQAVTAGDVEPRVAIMYALQRLNTSDAKPAVPTLIEVLGHQDPRVRRTAAETLGKLGAIAESAVPALRRALGDEDQQVRINASEALLTIIPTKDE